MTIYLSTREAADRLGVPAERIAFQSSNAWDAYAASALGMRVVWCNRYGQIAERLPGQPGRVAWHGWAGEPGAADRLDVHHAWLVEDLDGGRVRILTQETQKGAPALELARARPQRAQRNQHQCSRAPCMTRHGSPSSTRDDTSLGETCHAARIR